MTTIVIPNPYLEICPVRPDDLEMVLKDLEISREEGGILCGIHDAA